MATWTQALTQIKKPSLSNREASGLVNLARAALRSFGGKLGAVKVDWYQLALWALDYFKAGDKFKIDTAHQLAPYSNPLELWEQLNGLAKQLDDAGIAFRQPTTVDPRGTSGGFRQLASDAWELMKLRRGQGSASPTEKDPVQITTTYTDANKVAWSIYEDPSSTQGYWLAEVTTTNAPYSPSLSAPSKAAVIEKVQAYVAAQGTTTPSSGGGGAGIALLLLLFLFASGKGRR
jgi:hypothetical protein